MAIERVQRVPPHVALLNEIDSRRKSLPVMAAGLAPLLEVVRAYIVSTEARLEAVEKTKA